MKSVMKRKETIETKNAFNYSARREGILSDRSKVGRKLEKEYEKSNGTIPDGCTLLVALLVPASRKGAHVP